MGSVYSNNRIKDISSAISVVIPAIGNVAMQFTILAVIIKYLFGNESSVLIILSVNLKRQLLLIIISRLHLIY